MTLRGGNMFRLVQSLNTEVQQMNNPHLFVAFNSAFYNRRLTIPIPTPISYLLPPSLYTQTYTCGSVLIYESR
ncbi:hypothetical protein OUZ56_027849 [Daphnia magna]|uniref:Uncharacterized protein n=1 Tax=Daphnia magna TaxID=35525 RepID=A0ABR0B241_9CRUS|nr:hypothetical protein OUZ56_027849 [Daphnia magna]